MRMSDGEQMVSRVRRHRHAMPRIAGAMVATVTLGVLGAMGAAIGSSQADTPGTAITVPSIEDFAGVACSSATTCLGVGEVLTGHGGENEGADVTITNGVPGPVVLDPYTAGLDAAACPTPSTCFAVGSGLSGGEIDTFTNDVLSSHESPTPGILQGIACENVTVCVAVGIDSNLEAGPAVVVSINNGNPEPPVIVTGVASLMSVGCWGPFCEGVGQNTSGQSVIVPISNGIAGAPVVVPGASVLFGVACASEHSCVVVGRNNSAKGVEAPFINGALGSLTVVQSTSVLFGVACASATLCSLVGSASSGDEGIDVPFDNGALGPPSLVPSMVGFGGVSCATATSCEAVGQPTPTTREGAVDTIAMPVATSLKAAPVKVQFNLLSGTLTSVSGTLTQTNSGAPISGAILQFTADGTSLCTATTNASGIATCAPSLSGTLAVMEQLGDTVTFAPTTAYLGSKASGSLSG